MENEQYSTIERLMEFGMGMAVARQMVNTMNNCLSNSANSGGNNGVATPPPLPQFYAIINNVQVGPMNEVELQQLIVAGRIQENTLMWIPGLRGWVVAKSIPQVYKLFIFNQIQQP